MIQKGMRWALTVAGVLLASEAFAESAAPKRALIEPKADEVLKKMGRHLAGTRAFTFEAYVTEDELLDSGQKIQLSSVRKIAVRRPNKISGHLSGDIDNRWIVYDGRSLAILDRTENTYRIASMPDNIDQMMDVLFEKYGVAAPIADLLVSDPYASAIRAVRIGRYLGLHNVRGVKCHHLAFRQDAIDWQVWVEAGDKPLPRKLVITYRELLGQPQFVASFEKWNLKPDLPDGMFVFTAPEGAKKVAFKPVDAAQPPRAAPGVETKQ